MVFIGLGLALRALSGPADAGLRSLRAAQEILESSLIIVFVPGLVGAALWATPGVVVSTAASLGVQDPF